MSILFVRGIRRTGMAAAFILLGALLMAGAVVLAMTGGGSAAAYIEENPYKVRSEMLMEATREIGACTPEEAVRVWAGGVSMRNGAMQYAVMTARMQDIYARQLDEKYPNWVTGVSSPWVEGVAVAEVQQPGIDRYVYYLCFEMYTSTGPAGVENAAVTVVRDGDFWRVSEVVTDPGLEAHTGYRPNA